MEANPVDRGSALALARRARQLFIKVGRETLRFDAARNPLSAAEAASYLVHEDGLMRIPVLVWDDLLVRGYTEALYEEALASRAPAAGGQA
jgi:arsenate reductase-like glutaredoxin family protein